MLGKVIETSLTSLPITYKNFKVKFLHLPPPWLELPAIRYKSQTGSTRIAHLGSSEKRFYKPLLLDVCADFTKVSVKIRARVISRGLIIFLYVDPRWAIWVDPVLLFYLPKWVITVFGKEINANPTPPLPPPQDTAVLYLRFFLNELRLVGEGLQGMHGCLNR